MCVVRCGGGFRLAKTAARLQEGALEPSPRSVGYGMKAVFQILAPGRPEAATNCQARRRSADRCCRTRPRSPLESGKRQESIQHGWFLERLIVGSQASNRVCPETCGRRGSCQQARNGPRLLDPEIHNETDRDSKGCLWRVRGT